MTPEQQALNSISTYINSMDSFSKELIALYADQIRTAAPNNGYYTLAMGLVSAEMVLERAREEGLPC